MKLLKDDSVGIQNILHTLFDAITTAFVDTMQPLDVPQHYFQAKLDKRKIFQVQKDYLPTVIQHY